MLCLLMSVGSEGGLGTTIALIGIRFMKKMEAPDGTLVPGTMDHGKDKGIIGSPQFGNNRGTTTPRIKKW